MTSLKRYRRQDFVLKTSALAYVFALFAVTAAPVMLDGEQVAAGQSCMGVFTPYRVREGGTIEPIARDIETTCERIVLAAR